MLIIHMQGGLGNQLYQYALYEQLKSLGKAVKIDAFDYTEKARFPEKRPVELGKFEGLSPEYCTLTERYRLKDDCQAFFSRIRRKLFGNQSRIYEEKNPPDMDVFGLEEGYLEGFWENEAYFSDIFPDLKSRIRFKALDEKNLSEAAAMEAVNSVGIHIRLGDYTDEKYSWRYEGICTKKYYEKALETVEHKFGGAPLTVYIFTDEPEKVKKWMEKGEGDFPLSFLREDGQIGEIVVCDWNSGDESYKDMFLMSRCRALICANSTFSMWGARLAQYENNIKIRPLRHDNTENYDLEYMKANWKGWHLIDSEGKLNNLM